jgi:hypothetical protein
MAEMLLINPRRRKAAKRVTAKRRVIRRKNPIALVGARKRRHNPIGLARVHRRRRNPIGVSKSAIMSEIKNALVGGAGAVAMDVLMGQINGYIPASMQRVPGKLGVGDAVKMALTIAAGQMLNKSTKGLSRQMATGALTCQARDIIASFVPASMTLGYASPARIVQGTQRVGPLMQRVGAYASNSGATADIFGSNRSPLLDAYSPPGRNRGVLLSGARAREGVTTYL